MCHINGPDLQAWRDVVDDADGLAVGVPRQGVGDDMVFHLAGWLVSRLHPVDGLTCGALEAAIFIAIVVHGHQALDMVLVPTLGQTPHGLTPRDATHPRAFVAGGAQENLHADGAVLLRVKELFHMNPTWAL